MGKMALLGCLFLASLLSALPGVRAEDARIAPASEVTEWELNSLMHVQLTTPETEALRITYSVYPLTEPAGLNRSDRSVSLAFSSFYNGKIVVTNTPAVYLDPREPGPGRSIG
jgi:hypothetical protein